VNTARTACRPTPASSIDACCGSVRDPGFDEESAVAFADGFAALADPIRLRLLALIASERRTGVCVCDLVAHVDRSQPTVSHHLRVLREAGLVSSEKRGTWAWYHVNSERLAQLRNVLR
jgi:ArsR family transcriptional regulator